MSATRIGWIGLGNMGVPMAKNLLKAGFELTVYNRTAAKAAPLLEAGARLALSAAAIWADADVVITMVADDGALREIHQGKDGLLAGAGGVGAAAPDEVGAGGVGGGTAAAAGVGAGKPGAAGSQRGKLVIDMSTVSPVTTRELAAAMAARGIDYLDAPVAGSVKPAELGQLVIMAGGKKEVYESALPIFGPLSKASFLLGEQGAGNNAKLAINTLLAFNVQGLAESVLFAKEKGIRPEAMLAVIGESALSNPLIKMKSANLAEGDFQAAFALKHLAKDLRLAQSQGLHTPGGTTLHDSFQQALAAGWGDKDISAIFPFLEGTKV
jgi:3-hydroxyisobutyrate dehydrogenase